MSSTQRQLHPKSNVSHSCSFDFSNRRFVQVLSHELFQNSPRDLDLVELWSGVQSLVNAARFRKLSAEPFDIDRDPPRTANEEDILSFGLSACYNSNSLRCFNCTRIMNARALR